MAKRLVARTLAALAGLSIVFAIGASAEPVFRWKDNQGNPVFSDRAPTPNQPFVVIGGSFRSPGPGTFLSAVSPYRHQLNQLELKGGQTAIPERVSIDDQRESLKSACNQARTTQQALSAGGRLFWRENDGVRVWLDADTRATQGALAKEIIRLAC